MQRLLGLVAYCFATTLFAQNAPAESFPNDFYNKVDAIVTEKMAEYEIPGLALGVVHDGHILYTKGYGVKNIEKESQVTENSVFHTASISKLFTALAIMDLIDEQKLSLDQPLVDLIPDMNYTCLLYTSDAADD